MNKIFVIIVIITCYQKKNSYLINVLFERPQILQIKRNSGSALAIHSECRGRARGWPESDFPGQGKGGYTLLFPIL